MWPLKRISLKLILKLAAVVAFLGMLAVLRHKTDWRNTYMFHYSWLEITDADGNPEAACNCSAILQGDQEEIEKAKILAVRQDFQKAVQIPDEYYVNATQDCRSVPTYKYHFFPVYIAHIADLISLYVCRTFKIMRKYLQNPLSQEEKEFPLAYSMVVHHKVWK